MPTYLDLVYYGNYVGRGWVSGIEIFQFFGNFYMSRPYSESSIEVPDKILAGYFK